MRLIAYKKDEGVGTPNEIRELIRDVKDATERDAAFLEAVLARMSMDEWQCDVKLFGEWGTRCLGINTMTYNTMTRHFNNGTLNNSEWWLLELPNLTDDGIVAAVKGAKVKMLEYRREKIKEAILIWDLETTTTFFNGSERLRRKVGGPNCVEIFYKDLSWEEIARMATKHKNLGYDVSVSVSAENTFMAVMRHDCKTDDGETKPFTFCISGMNGDEEDWERDLCLDDVAVMVSTDEALYAYYEECNDEYIRRSASVSSYSDK